MKKLYATLFSALMVGCAVCAGCTTKKVSSSAEVVDIIHKVNGYWQTNHPEHGRSFWINAAYHTGNMEALLPDQQTGILGILKRMGGT